MGWGFLVKTPPETKKAEIIGMVFRSCGVSKSKVVFL